MPQLSRPFARHLPILAAVVATALAAAVPAAAQPKPEPGAATAQGALDALQTAIDKGDVPGAMAVLTPAGRTQFAKDTVTETLMFLAFMDPNDPMPGGPKEAPAALAKKKAAYGEAKTAIAAAFKPSGLDGAIGKPVMQKETQAILEKGIATAEPVGLVSKVYTAMAKAAPALGGPPGVLKLPLRVGPFTALKVDGAKATVKSGPKTLHLEQTAGRWYLNAPVPEPDAPQ